MLKIALDKWYRTSVIKPNSLKTLLFQQSFDSTKGILVN